MSKFQVIHAKLAWQSIAYFCHRIDWFEWNSAETSTTWASSKPFSVANTQHFLTLHFSVTGSPACRACRFLRETQNLARALLVIFHGKQTGEQALAAHWHDDINPLSPLPL
jgi:hypothetical protein